MTAACGTYRIQVFSPAIPAVLSPLKLFTTLHFNSKVGNAPQSTQCSALLSLLLVRMLSATLNALITLK